MSADRWSECPRCKYLYDESVKEKINEIKSLYGKIPEEEYLQKYRDAKISLLKEFDTSMRQDYEFYGAENGVLNIRFSASCNECGFSWSYKHEEKIPFNE